MVYSNDQTQIKAGLSNYIGALLKASPWEEKSALNNVNSILAEQILKLSQDKEKNIDPYCFEPVLKILIVFLKQRIELLKKYAPSLAKEQIDKYIDTIQLIEDILKNIK